MSMRTRTIRAERSTRPANARTAFTIMEFLIALLIIGTLIGLLLAGIRYASSSTRTQTQRYAVASIREAMSRFEADFGFLPPLIREQADLRNGQRPVIVERPGDTAMYRVYRTVLFSTDELNAETRRSLNPQWAFRLGRAPANSANPFEDPRFSDYSIAAYLATDISWRYTGSVVDEPDNRATGTQVPIDGVPGPGSYRPREDGRFDIPRDIRRQAQGQANIRRVRRAPIFGSLIQTVGRDLRLTEVSTRAGLGSPNPDALLQAVTDRNRRAYRYYRWLPGRLDTSAPANLGVVTFPIETDEDLNIPRLVGRIRLPGEPTDPPVDRDLAKNSALRSARWAIVGAGGDGFFGDEDGPGDLDAMRVAVGANSGQSEVQVRVLAERDNIVELGLPTTGPEEQE